MIVVISGSINAGKSTVARRLTRLVPGSLYIDGDDLAPSGLPSGERWSAAIDLIGLATLSLARAKVHLFVAYPVDNKHWESITAPLQAGGYEVTCVALAPRLDVALTNRGERALEERERARISAMYDEGFHNPSFASLIVDNSDESADVTAQRIYEHLQLD